MTKPRKTSKTYDLIEFIRPEATFWPYPYTIEDAYQILILLTREGAHLHIKEHWGTRRLWQIVCGSNSYHNNTLTLTTSDDIRACWSRLLLAKTFDAAERWRQDNAITPAGQITRATHHYKAFSATLSWESESAIKKAFATFFSGYLGKTLSISLNSVHPTARTIIRTSIVVTERHTRFVLSFGTAPKNGLYSWWHETLTQVRNKESILDALSRALHMLDRLTSPSPDDAAIIETARILQIVNSGGNNQIYAEHYKPLRSRDGLAVIGNPNFNPDAYYTILTDIAPAPEPHTEITTPALTAAAMP